MTRPTGLHRCLWYEWFNAPTINYWTQICSNLHRENPFQELWHTWWVQHRVLKPGLASSTCKRVFCLNSKLWLVLGGMSTNMVKSCFFFFWVLNLPWDAGPQSMNIYGKVEAWWKCHLPQFSLHSSSLYLWLMTRLITEAPETLCLLYTNCWFSRDGIKHLQMEKDWGCSLLLSHLILGHGK